MTARMVIDARDLASAVVDGMAICTECHTTDSGLREPTHCPACETGVLVPLLSGVALGMVEIIPETVGQSGPLIERVVATENTRLFGKLLN